MNADRLNRWLTLTANIGVVLGLLLLIFELRQNQDLVRAQIHQARSDAWVSNRFESADSEFLLPAYDKFIKAGGPLDLTAFDNLDTTESARITRYAQALMGDYDNLFYQFQQGYLDEEYYRSRVETGIKRWAPIWKKSGLLHTMTPGFLVEVERHTSGD